MTTKIMVAAAIAFTVFVVVNGQVPTPQRMLAHEPGRLLGYTPTGLLAPIFLAVAWFVWRKDKNDANRR